MESCEEAFQVFINSLDAGAFLSQGNEAVEALGKFQQYLLNQVTCKHLMALVNIIFLKAGETDSALVFFAAQTLEYLAGWFGDRIVDEELFAQSLNLLYVNRGNLTASGYCGQFIRQFVQKKNKSLDRVLSNKATCERLLDCLQSLQISIIAKEIIENLQEGGLSLTQVLLASLQSKPDNLKAYLYSDILHKTIKSLSKNLVSQINEELLHLFLSSSHFSEYFLKIVREILNLQDGHRIKNLMLKVIHEHTNCLTSQLSSSQGQKMIDILYITQKAILSDFCSMNYLIGSSPFIKISTVRSTQDYFFTQIWNSQLHLAYYSLISASISSHSNALIESIFAVGLPALLVFHSENPTVLKGASLVRKGNMGFVTRIGLCLRDSRIDFIRTQLKFVEGWDRFLMYMNKQENLENSVLGGRTRYRHLTADEITSFMGFDKVENLQKPEIYFDRNFWGLPNGELDESL